LEVTVLYSIRLFRVYRQDPLKTGHGMLGPIQRRRCGMYMKEHNEFVVDKESGNKLLINVAPYVCLKRVKWTSMIKKVA